MVQNTQERGHGNFKYDVIFPVFFVLFSLIISVLFFASGSNISPDEAVSIILNNLFSRPSANRFFGSENVYMILYMTIILILAVSKGFAVIIHGFMLRKGKQKNYYVHNSFRLLVIFFVIIIYYQFFQHAQYFRSFYGALSNNKREKNTNFWISIYFCDELRKTFRGIS